MIIGISGKAGCGKSTVARLVAEILKGQKVSFADALRKEIFDIFGIPMRHMTASREYKDSMDIFLGLKQTTLRELMQWWGMVRREQSLDYWVNAALANCKGNGVYVFDDVRFLNEFLELKSIGAPVFRILPYPGWQPGVGSEHPSETDLDLVSLGAWTRVFNPAKGGLAHVVDTIVDMAREVMPDAAA